MNIFAGLQAIGNPTFDGSKTGLALGDFMMGKFRDICPGYYLWILHSPVL